MSPSCEDVHISVSGALRKHYAGQVNGSQQHAGVGLHLQGCGRTIVQGAGDICGAICGRKVL